MKNKKERLSVIADVLRLQVVGSQEEMLEILRQKGINTTQATLSRDFKKLKVAKTPLSNGAFKYMLPPKIKPIAAELNSFNFTSAGAVLSLDFSGQLAVLKTKPGYANAIAWNVDNKGSDEILGTIAGDDTVLLIPREGVDKEDVVKMIKFIFNKENSIAH